MVQPVPYPVSTPYGIPGDWAAGAHTGEDYACPEGTPVVAAGDGTVLLAEDQGDYGLRIDIQGSGRQHSYSHLSRIEAAPGQAVAAGQRIGLSGSTGRSTGPHLHYEERLPPYGYYDHTRPVLPSQPGQQEQEDDMAKAIFFQKGGTRYIAYPGAGVYRALANPADETDSKAVLEKSGQGWTEWSPGKDVGNLEAFGVRI